MKLSSVTYLFNFGREEAISDYLGKQFASVLIDTWQISIYWYFEEERPIISTIGMLVLYTTYYLLLRIILEKYIHHLDLFKDDKALLTQFQLLHGKIEKQSIDRYDEADLKKIKVFSWIAPELIALTSILCIVRMTFPIMFDGLGQKITGLSYELTTYLNDLLYDSIELVTVLIYLYLPKTSTSFDCVYIIILWLFMQTYGTLKLYEIKWALSDWIGYLFLAILASSSSYLWIHYFIASIANQYTRMQRDKSYYIGLAIFIGNLVFTRMSTFGFDVKIEIANI